MTKNDYELDYWRSVKKLDFDRRYKKILGLWEINDLNGDILEIGTGPRSGALKFLSGDRVSLDPLNSTYKSENLLHEINEIEYITGSIEDFTTTKTFDYILCANALDHGESDFSSLSVIKGLLKQGGRLYLMVHLRELEQLNEGHDHYMDIEVYRKQLSGFKEVFTKIYPQDPTGDGNYKTLISCLEKL